MAVIYSEHLKDYAAALTIIDEAIDKLGTNEVLQDQLARVHFYWKQDRKALDIWQELLPRWRTAPSFDLQFSVRWAGMAAAREEGWPQALDWFQFGRDCTESRPHYRIMNIGFKGDVAFAKWKVGDRADALRLFVRVLEDCESLPARNEDIKSLTLYKRLGHTISWINQDARGDYLPEFFEPPAGCMSNLETFEELKSYPSLPDDFLWSLLATTEDHIGVTLGIRKRFIERTSNTDSPILQFERKWFVLEEKFRDGTLDDLIFPFADLAATRGLNNDPYLEKLASLARDAASPLEYPFRTAVRDRPQDISSDTVKNGLISLLLAALFTLESRRIRWHNETLARWRGDSEKAKLLSAEAEELLENARIVRDQSVQELILTLKNETPLPQVARMLAATRLSSSDEIALEILLYAHVTLLEFFRQSSWRGLIETDLELVVVKMWKEAIRNRSFSMLAPNLTGPSINNACEDRRHGLSKVAAIVLAASAAVSLRLPDQLRQMLHTLAGNDGE